MTTRFHCRFDRLACSLLNVGPISSMILALLKDRSLLQAVRRASLPVEDVFIEADDIRAALRAGSPRVLIIEPGSDEAAVRLIR